MTWLRRLSVLGLALLLTVGAACTTSDGGPTDVSPTTSAEQPSFGLIGDLTGTVTNLTGTLVGTLGQVTDLLTCSPQKQIKETETIGPRGGRIRVGSHELEIPKGALDRNTRITAEQIKGKTNSVRFTPEGLQFKKPAQLTMSYENCVLVLIQKKIVYTDEKLKILEVLQSLDLFKKKTVSAPIDHFSRYALAF